MAKKLPFSKMLWRSRRSFLGVLLALLLSPIVFFMTDQAKVIIQDLTATNRLVQKSLEGYVEQHNGIGCKMPQLNPFDESIPKFTENMPIVTCKGTDWVTCYKSECSVTSGILKTVKDIVCIYRDIIYIHERKFNFGHPVKVIGKDKFSLNKSDHVKIECTGKNLNRPGERVHWSGLKAGFRPVQTEKIPPDREDSYNVMILCLDSMSRNGFIRKMQHSYKYLTEKLNAVILNSYNIVGDGTTGALYPILTGKPEEELTYAGKRAARNKYYVNSTKFIFHMLKEYGYRTAYFEDMPWIGTPQYMFNWFRRQPADHYLRTLLLADISQSDIRYQGRHARHCFGSTPQYQLMMNLADEFLRLDGKKFCFTLIVDVTSENFTVLPSADETLLSFLQTLSARRALEDTLVLVMGDHGSRFSTIRGTSQGKLEERLPLMAILLPEKLKKLRPTALTSLKNNMDVLTTPFDIHATVLDVLDLKAKSNMHTVPGSNLPRAMSLLELIPKSRTCGEAGVMPHWCACTQWSPVSNSSPMYNQVAKVLAEYINSISVEHRLKCAKRHLISTEWVKHQNATDYLSKVNYFGMKELTHLYKHPNSHVLKTLDEYYQAKIIMSPGKSEFEGTMIYNTASDYFMITQRDISRVNAYGDEPKCISATHPHLNKYCFCKDKLNDTIINSTIIAK